MRFDLRGEGVLMSRFEGSERSHPQIETRRHSLDQRGKLCLRTESCDAVESVYRRRTIKHEDLKLKCPCRRLLMTWPLDYDYSISAYDQTRLIPRIGLTD